MHIDLARTYNNVSFQVQFILIYVSERLTTSKYKIQFSPRAFFISKNTAISAKNTRSWPLEQKN